MAERRMFHTAVVESDGFLDMTPAAQALYFHIGMHADDDGFVNGPRQVCRTVGARIEELQELIDGGFLLWFDGVAVVKHFRMANTLQNDRIKQLRYPEVAKQLYILPNRIYSTKEGKRKDNLFVIREKTIRELKRKGARLLESKRNPNRSKPNTTQPNSTQSNLIQSNPTQPNTIPPAGGGLPATYDEDGSWGVPNDSNIVILSDHEQSRRGVEGAPVADGDSSGTLYPQNDSDNPVILSGAKDPHRRAISTTAGDSSQSKIAQNDSGSVALLEQERKGVVQLTSEQVYELMTRMDYASIQKYVTKLADFILQKNAAIDDHFATILKWWQQDGGKEL